MRVIAIGNQKGGVGKTSTAVHLAHALALSDRRVLLVDADPQTNSGFWLLGDRQPHHGLDRVIADTMNKPSVHDLTVTARPNLDILCAGLELSEANDWLVSRVDRTDVIRKRFDAVTEYDYIIFDTQPSLTSWINISVFNYVTEVIAPMRASALSKAAIDTFSEQINTIREYSNSNIKLSYILITHYIKNQIMSNLVDDYLAAKYPTTPLLTIRKTTKLEACAELAQTLFEYAQNSTATEDYLEFAARVMVDEL